MGEWAMDGAAKQRTIGSDPGTYNVLGKFVPPWRMAPLAQL